MVETEVSPNGTRALPQFVKIQGAPRFSANQLRMVQAATGRSMEQLMNDAASVVQAFVWLQLRRDGYEVTFDEAGDVPIEFADDVPDPTSSATATD